MVPSHDGMPDPRRTGSLPGLIGPASQTHNVWGPGDAETDSADEKRRQGREHATKRRAHACQGSNRRSPITHIRRRLAACAWKHGEAGLTRRSRVWVGRHMRSMCVTAGWGSHRHDNGVWEFRRLCNSAEYPLKRGAPQIRNARATGSRHRSAFRPSDQ